MKNNKKTFILLIIIGVLLFGFLFYKVYIDFFKKENNKVLDSIELYGYTLDKNDTQIYKDNFKELSKVLNEKPIDYDKYAEYISKLFIIDLFTLDNKLASTDIGGLDFIHPDLKNNFKEYIGYTMYKNIEINLDGNRKQELPIVKNVIIDTLKESKFTYNEVSYEGYDVKANIEYEKDLGYQKEINLKIIKDDKILYIVKGE